MRRAAAPPVPFTSLGTSPAAPPPRRLRPGRVFFASLISRFISISEIGFMQFKTSWDSFAPARQETALFGHPAHCIMKSFRSRFFGGLIPMRSANSDMEFNAALHSSSVGTSGESSFSTAAASWKLDSPVMEQWTPLRLLLPGQVRRFRRLLSGCGLPGLGWRLRGWSLLFTTTEEE